jgi:catechol 2,3-dioxygenase-like lactoylglutathione lyase family enzyme
MKTHLHLETTDLDKSVDFYRALLSDEPVKRFGDYALFVSEDPGLELAIGLRKNVAAAHAAHFGIAVDSVEPVERAIRRLEAAGIETEIEREETCCYAKQTKLWATDPDGRRWEVYTVHEEMNAEPACC